MTETEFDVNYLLKAINNETNESILELDHKKINNIKNNVLDNLELPKTVIKQFKKKLSEYKYVDELPELHYGRYIRWISFKDPNNVYLTNGGIICDIKVVNGGINITCRNNMGRLFQLKTNENIIFQKLTKQEKLLLTVIKHLNT